MTYHNLVFTKHAQERSRQRGITLDAVEAAVLNPDQKFVGKQPGTTKFIKTIKDRRLHIVAQYLSDEHKWLVISVWVRGEDDQAPLSWQLIVLPFKLAWWVIKRVYKLLRKLGL